MALSDVVGPMVDIVEILKHTQDNCGCDIYLTFQLSDKPIDEMKSPVYTFKDLQDCQLQGCIRKLDMEMLELGLKINVNENISSEIDFKNPLIFTWKVCAFNLKTDTTEELSEAMKFNASEEKNSQFIHIPLKRVEDLFHENSILFQWHIELQRRLHTTESFEDCKSNQLAFVGCQHHLHKNSLEHHVHRISTSTERTTKFLCEKQSEGLFLDLREKVLMYRTKLSSNQEAFDKICSHIDDMNKRLTTLLDRYNEHEKTVSKLGELLETREPTAPHDPHITETSATLTETQFIQKIHEIMELEVDRSTKNQVFTIYPHHLPIKLQQIVHAKYYDGTPLSVTLVHYNTLTSFKDMRDAIDGALKDSNRYLPNMKFLFHQVMPYIYDRRNVLGISYIATCSDLELQERALDVLETLIFTNDTQDVMDLEQFQKAQLILTETICEHRNEEVTNQSRFQVILQRTCIMILQLQGMILLSCKKADHYADLERFNTKLK